MKLACFLGLLLPAISFAGPDEDLLSAISRGSVVESREALHAGASPNARDLLGTTALFRAAEADQAEIVALLLDSRARIDAKSGNRMTALMGAAVSGAGSAARVLLERGAEILFKDRQLGLNAYRHALREGHAEVAEMIRIEFESRERRRLRHPGPGGSRRRRL